MAYTLVGTVVSSCDTAGDFTNNNAGANISTDDDFVEGTGAIGDKMSGSNELLVSDNLSGGAAGVYDFSSGGADEGAHFIGWLNTKTSIQATTGLQVMFRNASGHEGSWYVIPAFFYKGGFITRVINPEADFNTATTWTTTGNPAQLDDVSEMGFEFDMLATIMGNFNNAQADQFTVGFGVRADAGTVGTPNDFAGVVNYDEGTNFYGWWSSVNGSNLGKGKLYIGPATGTAASHFNDSAFAVNFADENVAVGFYEFSMRGANTFCDWTLANISAANPANARWSLTLDSAMGSTTGGFNDTNGTWVGSDVLTLNQYASLTGTTIINGNSAVQNTCTMSGVTVLTPQTVTNVAYLLVDDPAEITDCQFNFNSAGHGIEIDTAGTYTWDGNTFVGAYGGTPGTNLTPSSGSADAMILNSSGGLVTLNLINGATVPSVRNTAVSTTQINASVTAEVTGVTRGTSLKVVALETLGSVTAGDVLMEEFADAAGEASFSHNDEGTLQVVTRARNQGIATACMAEDGGVFVDETAEGSSNSTADMTLLPATPVANDAYNFGHQDQFTRLKLDISTALVQSVQHTIVWEYWNGAWVALSGVVDGTDQFETAGQNIVSWTLPGDWVARSLANQDNVGNVFYVRARLSVLGTISTTPVGRKVQLDTQRYLPYARNTEIETGVGMSDTAAWLPDTISKFDPAD